MAGRVKVYCRVRPPLPREDASDICVAVDEGSRFVEVSDEGGAIDRVLGGGNAEPAEAKKFEFDGVFGGSSSQKQVFQDVGLAACRDVLKGYNGCIFAYGQTGSGKTHSLLNCGGGNDGAEGAGVLPRVVATLFVQMAKDAANVYDVEAAAMQVYNEQVDDLLHPNHAQAGQNLKVNGMDGSVPALTWEKCQRPDSLLEMVQRARSKIVYAETKMNKASSRSHAVFQIKVTRRPRGQGSGNGSSVKTTFGTLSIVDLAGSERVKRSGVVGKEFKEATNINGSLLALGNVVSALASKSKHIPFRDSKLTSILQSSIGGNCKTSLLVCASPAVESAQETIGALEFASRAMRVVQEVKINEGTTEVSAAQLAKDLAGDDLQGVSSEAFVEQKRLAADLEQLLEKEKKAGQSAKAEVERHAREKATLEKEMGAKLAKEQQERAQAHELAAEAQRKAAELEKNAADVKAKSDAAKAEAAKQAAVVAKDLEEQKKKASEAEKARKAADLLAQERLKAVEQVKKQADEKQAKLLSDQGKKLDGLDKKISENVQKLARVEKENSQAKADLERERGRAASLAEQLSAAETRHAAQLQAAEEAHAAALTDVERKHAEKLQRIEAERCAIEEQCKVLEAQALQLQAANELQKELNEKLQTQLAALEDTRQRDLQRLEDALSSQQTDSSSQLKRMKSDAEALRQELENQLQEQRKAAEAQSATLRAAMNDVEVRLQEETHRYEQKLAEQQLEAAEALQEAQKEFGEERLKLEARMSEEHAKFVAQRDHLVEQHAQSIQAIDAQNRTTLMEVEERGKAAVRAAEQAARSAVHNAAERGQDMLQAAELETERVANQLFERSEELKDLQRRFDARESRPEDVARIARDTEEIKVLNRRLAERGFALQQAKLTLKNRDDNDVVFSVAKSHGADSKAARCMRSTSSGPKMCMSSSSTHAVDPPQYFAPADSSVTAVAGGDNFSVYRAPTPLSCAAGRKVGERQSFADRMRRSLRESRENSDNDGM
eukprot:TRINITY_DN28328_c0_g1_i1.p1 TRINITY_DN28328_c0_g1~~TRINITY_DN28328_c0_g1_i1.p1  ORF type:complete len:1008 (-),score=344.87 TRINITY_DN28328_c0_g1_i1:26-3049(-)